MTIRIGRGLKGLVVAALLFLTSPVQAVGLVEEPAKLVATFPGLLGSRGVELDALIIRPNDDRLHPLAVLNHGTPRTSHDRFGMPPSGMRAQAQEFARRGWVAVTFMRRGYGASGGDYAEDAGKCPFAAYEPVGRASADDVREVIRIMKEKPYVDGSRIISVGRSAGGFATVALTADPPSGLVAAINFAGGRGSERPDEVCNASDLVDAFAAFGKTSRVPMLWVYAENDHYFGPALAKQFHAAFTEAGGKAEFIAANPFGEDGHHLFSAKGTPFWTPYVDDFLARHNLTLVERLPPLNDDTGVHEPAGPVHLDRP